MFLVQKFCFCCFSSDEDKSQAGEPTERTTLLGNPVSNSIGRPLYGGDAYPSGDVNVPSNVVLPDEQEALKRILQQTANEIIDVSAIPSHLERKEYLERVKVYQQKLQGVQYHPIISEHRLLLKDLPTPDKVLMDHPLQYAELKSLEEIFSDMYRAIQDIQIQPHADLVAQFG